MDKFLNMIERSMEGVKAGRAEIEQHLNGLNEDTIDKMAERDWCKMQIAKLNEVIIDLEESRRLAGGK
jgi:hypothetical protein